MSKPTHWYFRVWDEGKYLDFWSFSHTLIGVVLAGLFLILDLSTLTSFIISLVIIIGWEIWEVIRNIPEVFTNKFFDVVTGIFGFWFMQFLIHTYGHPTRFFIIALCLYLFFELWGYIAFRHRGARFV